MKGNFKNKPSGWKRRDFPFLEYSVIEMFHHADAAQAGGVSQKEFVRDLHAQRDTTLRYWIHFWNDLSFRGYSSDVSLLYIASAENLYNLVALLTEDHDVNALKSPEEVYGTVLQFACHKASLEIVQLLLDKGADINARAGYYGTALQVVCAFSREANLSVIQLLLDRGADINAQSGKYGNALQAACYSGGDGKSIELFQLLLDRGADTNIQGGIYGNALQAACCNPFLAEYGDTVRVIELLQLLLDKGAEINVRGGYYGNALQAACANRSLYDVGGKFWLMKIVQLLLDKGADVNAQGGQYGSPLQAAIQHFGKDNKIVRMLLDHGAGPRRVCQAPAINEVPAL